MRGRRGYPGAMVRPPWDGGLEIGEIEVASVHNGYTVRALEYVKIPPPPDGVMGEMEVGLAVGAVVPRDGLHMMPLERTYIAQDIAEVLVIISGIYERLEQLKPPELELLEGGEDGSEPGDLH